MLLDRGPNNQTSQANKIVDKKVYLFLAQA